MLKFNTFLPYFTFNPSLSEFIECRKFRPPEFLTVHSAAGSPQSRL